MPKHGFQALCLFSRPCKNVPEAVGEARHQRWERCETPESPFPRKKTQAAGGAWYLGTLQHVWLESEPISQCHLLPARLLFPSPKARSPCKPPPPGGGCPRALVTPLAVGSQWSARGFCAGQPFPVKNSRDFLLLPVVFQVSNYGVDYVMTGC